MINQWQQHGSKWVDIALAPAFIVSTLASCPCAYLFKFVDKAINYEVERQIYLIKAGVAVVHREKAEAPFLSIISSTIPPPRAAQISGLSAIKTGKPVSSAINRSISLSSAPPGQIDPVVCDIRAQFGRRLLECSFNDADDGG